MTIDDSLLTLSTIAVLLALPGAAHAGGDAEAGKKKAKNCVTCHGAEGISVAPEFPNLAGQHADYLVISLKEYRDGTRKNAVMAGFAAGLSDDDIANLAAFYAAQLGLETLPRK